MAMHKCLKLATMFAAVSANAASGNCAEDADGCQGSEEVGLLQSQVRHTMTAEPRPMHLDFGKLAGVVAKAQDDGAAPAFKATATAAKASSCTNGVQADVSIDLEPGVSVQYKFSDVTDGKCNSEFTSCCIDWGSNVTVSGSGTLPKDVESGSTFSGTIKVYTKNLWGGWSTVASKDFSCALCGAQCSIGKVSILGVADFEIPTFDTPDCPISAENFALPPTTMTMPSSNPAGGLVTLKVAVSPVAKYANGDMIASASMVAIAAR